jgi:uncharacterized protein YjbI with pentapeptide repeats
VWYNADAMAFTKQTTGNSPGRKEGMKGRNTLLLAGMIVAALMFAANSGHTFNENDVQRLKSTGKCPHCDLSGANLSDANLHDVDLTNANLMDTNLSGANLKGANLTHAMGIGANLSGTNMTGAILSTAGLTKANLTNAVLTKANLTNAVLFNANLSEAKLSDTNLAGAQLLSATWTDGKTKCKKPSIGQCDR